MSLIECLYKFPKYVLFKKVYTIYYIMVCSGNTRCLNPNIVYTDNEAFCFNCYQSFKKNEQKPIKVNKFQCCNDVNILFQDDYDICVSCYTIHQKFVDKATYLENDEYETNVLYKSKKVHLPYKYLKKIYPQIKLTIIYDFIMESIDEIKKFYNLKERPFKTYVPYLYNYYQMKNKDIPIIESFKKEKYLFLEKELIDKINDIHNKYSDSNNENNENINIKELVKKDDKLNNKYYYFNKSKNKYFKKTRYCQFQDCLKIGNFKSNNINYCKKHSTNFININNKTISKKCDYNNCKRNVINKYCQNHKYKCIDNECNIRITKDNSYCKIHR